MDIVPGCAACRRISETYETETMTWFRLEGQFRIAEYGHDDESARRIALELDATTLKRSDLRTAMERHKADFHTGGSQTNRCFMSA